MKTEITVGIDLTNINDRRVAQIALPMMLSNITVPLLGFFDTAVIGQLGDPTLIAALGLGSILISTLYWLCGFLRMGTTGLTAQAKGEDNQREVVQILIRGLLIGVLLGILILLVALPVFRLFFFISPAEPSVEAHALTYAKIRVFSAPLAIANIVLIGWLIAMERALRVFFVQFFVNILNLSLSMLLVFKWEYGIEGVAYATLISEVCGFFLSLTMCRNVLDYRSNFTVKGIFDLAKWMNLFSINFNIFLRSLLLEMVFLSFLFWGASFGTLIQAANQILIQFLHIFSYALDGFAFSAEVLVGISYGRKRLDDLRNAVLICSKWAAITALGLSIVVFFFGPIFIGFMTTSAEVVNVANEYLVWITLAPTISFLAYIMDGIFLGSTHTVAMRKAMLIATAFYFSVAIIFSSVYQNHGLWLSLSLFLIARALTLFYFYPNIERSVSDIRYS